MRDSAAIQISRPTTIFPTMPQSGSILSVKSKSGVVTKCGACLWNRVAIYNRSKAISNSSLVAAVLNRQPTTSRDIDIVLYSGRSCLKMGSCWNDVCNVAGNWSHIDQQKHLWFLSMRVPLVFQVSPGTGKSYVHAENAKPTFGIRSLWNRFWHGF